MKDSVSLLLRSPRSPLPSEGGRKKPVVKRPVHVQRTDLAPTSDSPALPGEDASGSSTSSDVTSSPSHKKRKVTPSEAGDSDSKMTATTAKTSAQSTSSADFYKKSYHKSGVGYAGNHGRDDVSYRQRVLSKRTTEDAQLNQALCYVVPARTLASKLLSSCNSRRTVNSPDCSPSSESTYPTATAAGLSRTRTSEFARYAAYTESWIGKGLKCNHSQYAGRTDSGASQTKVQSHCIETAQQRIAQRHV